MRDIADKLLVLLQLDIAMQNIAEGNLEYMLTTEEKGEIGELYRNYEDMRLRLKESTDEKFEHEQKNKELVSNISHDLKTPITAIKGYVEGIMDGVQNKGNDHIPQYLPGDQGTHARHDKEAAPAAVRKSKVGLFRRR